MADPVEELLWQRPVEPIGQADRLDIGGTGLGTGHGKRRVAGQAGQGEADNKHRQANRQSEDGAAEQEASHT